MFVLKCKIGRRNCDFGSLLSAEDGRETLFKPAYRIQIRPMCCFPARVPSPAQQSATSLCLSPFLRVPMCRNNLNPDVDSSENRNRKSKIRLKSSILASGGIARCKRKRKEEKEGVGGRSGKVVGLRRKCLGG